MQNGQDVAVSNTFIRQWEIEPYRQLAAKYDYNVVIKTMNGNYQNVHGVPQSKVEQMRQNFEP
jgi:hypothetical protein